jgi:hypothetical protein
MLAVVVVRLVQPLLHLLIYRSSPARAIPRPRRAARSACACLSARPSDSESNVAWWASGADDEYGGT